MLVSLRDHGPECKLMIVFTVVVLVRLHRYRSEFSRLVQIHSTTRSRFLRLFLLSAIFLLGNIPSQVTVLYFNLPRRLKPYSWSRSHDPRLRQTIVIVPAYGLLIPDRWICLICGFLIFLFFGLGTDASAMYRSWLAKINPLRLFRRRNDSHRLQHRHHHRHWPCSSSSDTDTSSSPTSPTRSILSYKTYCTSSAGTAKSSLSKSLRNSPLTFWKETVVSATTNTASTASPILPTHNHPRASVAPTIDTAISMTPLSDAIRKASVGTLVAVEDEDVAILSESPVDWEKRMARGSGFELGIELEGLDRRGGEV